MRDENVIPLVVLGCCVSVLCFKQTAAAVQCSPTKICGKRKIAVTKFYSRALMKSSFLISEQLLADDGQTEVSHSQLGEKSREDRSFKLESQNLLDIVREHIAANQLTSQDARDEANVIVAAVGKQRK